MTAALLLPPPPVGCARANNEASTGVSSDTRGYMQTLKMRVKTNWQGIASARADSTVVGWKIHRDGSVSDIKILQHGATAADDQAAIAAVKKSAPFARLPKEAPDSVDVQFTFESIRPKPLGLTVQQALKKYGSSARQRLAERFKRAGVVYPPRRSGCICLKDERALLLFAAGVDGKERQIARYPMVAYSGTLGPKLKEGDMQIPEGLYKPTSLDARTHLCFWVDYPNRFDREHARLEHRTNLGGDIQVHEGVASTGCVVVDHDSMAELFVLAHDIGCQNIDLIFAPCDLSRAAADVDWARQPKWLPGLYQELKKTLALYPIEPVKTTFDGRGFSR